MSPRPTSNKSRLVQRPAYILGICCLALGAFSARAQQQSGADRFAQMRDLLPTPNSFRTASGAPGHDYWQQTAHYDIDVQLDEENMRLTGKEKITYYNMSPDSLEYLWLHLEPNRRTSQSHSNLASTAPGMDPPSLSSLSSVLRQDRFDGSCTISDVRLADGTPLKWTVVDTTMRIDLPTPLLPINSAKPTSGGQGPGGSPAQWLKFEVSWSYTINNVAEVRARSGAEKLKDGSWIFGIAQWFPRMCAYTDYAGWQHKEFLGGGEFALEFGNYDVSITAPSNHVVTATGELVNAKEVLSAQQRERLKAAVHAERPVMIITREEADAQRLLANDENGGAESDSGADTKTWHFRARRVRDFAWSSSSAFLWDAMGRQVEGQEDPVLCMSFWPREGDPLWGKYSTHAVAHTLDVYGRRTFPYPYPVAISVNGVVGGGMEYPMFCFNGPRPNADGTYSKRTKYGLISVIIHEVGHNWFPMIVNSDERQWAWMDEGLNTFLQYQAEKEWEDDYPSRSGEPRQIVGYMSGDRQVPIMSNADTLLNGGMNAYSKPATALNILRETIIGREGFDFAFKTYARRWNFKRPEPADFFRTMEDASGVDLDWYFRNWFFTTDHVNLGITALRHYTMEAGGPAAHSDTQRAEADAQPKSLTEVRNAELTKLAERFPELLDHFSQNDGLDPVMADIKRWEGFVKGLGPVQKEVLTSGLHWYVVDLVSKGGIPMPVILKLQYEDGSNEEVRFPVELWRKSPTEVSKLLVCDRPLSAVVLDPNLETADADLSDNTWPPVIQNEVVMPPMGGQGRRGRR